MGQIISVSATTGEFLLPCFEFEADAFETGLAYNTSGLEIQVATNDGAFYRYQTSAGDVTNNVAPADNTEIGFQSLNANAWIAKLQLHLSVFSGLNIAAGESIGMIAMAATGFAPVVATLVFAKPIATDSSGVAEANVVQIGDSTSLVTLMSAAVGTMLTGTVDTVTNTHTPTTTQFQADDITEATADHYKDRSILFLTGALAKQYKPITGYSLVGGIGQFTTSAFTEAPANNDTFIIV